MAKTHTDTLKWVTESEASGHPWIVAFDEAGNAGAGSPPDPDWPGMEKALKEIAAGKQKLKVPSIDDIRAEVIVLLGQKPLVAAERAVVVFVSLNDEEVVLLFGGDSRETK